MNELVTWRDQQRQGMTGEWMALLTLIGAMLGMFSYAALKPKLPH